jgi:hypothetical protein
MLSDSIFQTLDEMYKAIGQYDYSRAHERELIKGMTQLRIVMDRLDHPRNPRNPRDIAKEVDILFQRARDGKYNGSNITDFYEVSQDEIDHYAD